MVLHFGLDEIGGDPDATNRLVSFSDKPCRNAPAVGGICEMGGQAKTKGIAEEVTKVAEACDILRARASVLGREVDTWVVDWPWRADVACRVTKNEDCRNLGLERAREGQT